MRKLVCMELAKPQIVDEVDDDDELEFATVSEEPDPVLTAITGLHFAYLAARTNPDEQSQQDLKAAWATMLLQMPPQIAIDPKRPVEAPKTAYDIQRMRDEALEIDRQIRSYYGHLLAMAAILGHPDAKPVDSTTVEAFDRNRALAAYVGSRVDYFLLNRRHE